MFTRTMRTMVHDFSARNLHEVISKFALIDGFGFSKANCAL